MRWGAFGRPFRVRMPELGAEASLGLAAGDVVLAEDHEAWGHAFAAERDRLRKSAGCEGLVHIGSTAVPGLPAKPVLDMLLSAPAARHDEIAASLTRCGYVDRGVRGGGGGRLLVRWRGAFRTHNLHLYEPADPEIADQLEFVAALRSDGQARALYAATKLRLVRDPDIDRRGYVEGKGPVVRAILSARRGAR